MPTFGRGGAGNIINESELSKANSGFSQDLEANRHTTTTTMTTADDPAAQATPSSTQQDYAHMGRGGAGNYYSPKDLGATGRFSDAHRSHIVGDGTLAPASGRADAVGAGAGARLSSVAAYRGSEAGAYRGRGGAGNFAGAGFEAEERRRVEVEEEEGRRRERLRGEIERRVEDGLARPERARVVGG
ncbi:hypothetical protein LTR66_011541 [Elasticomyces elasticus]|nr:hypothetical protein LTR28_002378 [Elasticomyces elasticus]KAK4970532.1 hypothetical protein LTR66_011541 [Elasticomyces elasticus]